MSVVNQPISSPRSGLTSQLSFESVSSADSNDSSEMNAHPSPGRGKMISVCKNCAYTFRRKSDSVLLEFCNKDCQTTFMLNKPPESPSYQQYNARFPSPVPSRLNNGPPPRTPDRPLTTREIKESIFKFQQDMDHEDKRMELKRSESIPPRPPPSMNRPIGGALRLDIPPPFPIAFEAQGALEVDENLKKTAFLLPTVDTSSEPLTKPPLSPALVLRKQSSLSFLNPLRRSGSGSPKIILNNNVETAPTTPGSGSVRGRTSPTSPSLTQRQDSYTASGANFDASRDKDKDGRATSPFVPGARLMAWTKNIMISPRHSRSGSEPLPVSALEYLSSTYAQ